MYKKQWEESYNRGENNIIFPKEECIKFISRYIAKFSVNGKIEYLNDEFMNAKALDFGCGLGTQTNLMSKYGLIPFGVDISEFAIAESQKRYPELKQNFSTILGDGSLDFEDDYFKVSLAESVLDSMHFDVAKKSIESIDRVTNGLVFISLIDDSIIPNGEKEVIVSDDFENGTVQSYYNQDKISQLLKDTSFTILDSHTLSNYNNQTKSVYDARTYMVLKSGK